MGRRCKDTGNPMLVILPTEGYKDTGEGGLAFFLIVKQKPFEQRRQTCLCLAGDLIFPQQDCLIKPLWLDIPQLIDAGLLIGSTGRSLWSDDKEEYFTPKFFDLTPEGKRLYHTLKRIYGEVTIVTLLDT